MQRPYIESPTLRPGIFHAANTAVVQVTREDLVTVRESSLTNTLREDPSLCTQVW